MSELLKNITDSDALARVGAGVATALDRVENSSVRDTIIVMGFGAVLTLAGVKVGADIATKQKSGERDTK